MFKRILLLALAVMMVSSAALAETITLDGTVTASRTHEVYAASTAIVESVTVHAGDSIAAGDTVATLRTTKVCAEEDGTVRAVFAQAGASADTLTEHYGAAIYLEGSEVYTVTASTANAYNAVDTKLVHPGETVYLRSRSESSRTGTGVISTVDGTDYQVCVTSGSFLMGEAVNIYRTADFADNQQLGKGTIGRTAPTAVTGTGRIVAIAVAAGDEVQRGDVLMETLEGSGTSPVLTSEVSGVVAEVNAAQGVSITEDEVAAVIWPYDAMQIAASVSESDLACLAPGDTVTLTFDWNADSGETLTGTVRAIAAMADEDSDPVTFTAYIDFEPTDDVRFGMNVTITVQE
ncbi:MAG: HlyD family efflux transporter periplasmic adaptor subunit [Aristaeellaceae bacterium]